MTGGGKWTRSRAGRAVAAGLLLLLGARAPAVETRWSALAVESATGITHRFRVEVAATAEAQARGLMFRTRLAANAGMLFDFRTDRMVAMWMKNTPIPLDMLFIRADGRIATIAERTVPYSLATISSRVPVRAVLEVNGGTVARLGIRPGDRVVHGIFARASGRVRVPTPATTSTPR